MINIRYCFCIFHQNYMAWALSLGTFSSMLGGEKILGWLLVQSCISLIWAKWTVWSKLLYRRKKLATTVLFAIRTCSAIWGFLCLAGLRGTEVERWSTKELKVICISFLYLKREKNISEHKKKNFWKFSQIKQRPRSGLRYTFKKKKRIACKIRWSCC